jgi:hypothetical protein
MLLEVQFVADALRTAIRGLCLFGVFAGAALCLPQRSEDYSLTSEIEELESFFGQKIATDGNTTLVVSGEPVPGSEFNGRIYFLELRDGRWEIEYISGELPGGEISRSVNDAVVEGDIAVVTGWAHTGAPGGDFEYLHTFERTPEGGWAPVAIQRIPEFGGFINAGRMELRAGLLTFGNWGRVVTYERSPSGWRRRPNLRTGPILAGSVPGLIYNLVRGDRDVFIVPVSGNGNPLASQLGWQHFSWTGNRWSLSQIIGFPQPPNTNAFYVPNGGHDAEGDWFMYGAHPLIAGVGVVIALKKDEVTGDYEYHSTIRPTISYPGGSDSQDIFGSTLDLDVSTGRLLVGAPFSGAPAGGIAGRALLFRYDEVSDRWFESEEYTYSERAQQGPNEYLDFGRQVALWDNGALVSAQIAPGASGVGGVGKLYVFEDSFGDTYCPGTMTAPGQDAVIDVSGSNVLPYAGLRIEATALPPSTPFSALISSASASVLLPQGSGERLCVGGPRVFTGGIRQSRADGSASLGFDLSDPSLQGVLVGDHRFVQLWFRMPPSSSQPVGLTNAVDVVFR